MSEDGNKTTEGQQIATAGSEFSAGLGPRRKPDGFIARCQCGEIVGAMDYTRTPRAEAGKMLGNWLAEGCTVEPRFGEWRETVTRCKCA